jgi:hypothetical protein
MIIRSAAEGLRLRCRWTARRTAATVAAHELDLLPEVQEATQFCNSGKHALALPLLQRAVDVLQTATGSSPITRAAQVRLGSAHFAVGQLQRAETSFATADSTPVSDDASLADVLDLRLKLIRTQLLLGQLTAAVQTCSTTVADCEQQGGATPDTESLGIALRHLGALQMLSTAAVPQDVDAAETNLLRAARLANAAVDHAEVGRR